MKVTATRDCDLPGALTGHAYARIGGAAVLHLMDGDPFGTTRCQYGGASSINLFDNIKAGQTYTVCDRCAASVGARKAPVPRQRKPSPGRRGRTMQVVVAVANDHSARVTRCLPPYPGQDAVTLCGAAFWALKSSEHEQGVPDCRSCIAIVRYAQGLRL